MMVFRMSNSCSIYEEPAVTMTSGVCGGDPCVPGTRIPAAQLYEYIWKLGWTVNDIVREFPELQIHQVERAIVWIDEHPGYWIEWREQFPESG